MTATYDDAEIARLIAEARPGAFDVNELTSWSIDCIEHFPITAPAATRLLQRLAAMADQLEAARLEIERLRELNTTLAKQSREIDTAMADKLEEYEKEHWRLSVLHDADQMEILNLKSQRSSLYERLTAYEDVDPVTFRSGGAP